MSVCESDIFRLKDRIDLVFSTKIFFEVPAILSDLEMFSVYWVGI